MHRFINSYRDNFYLSQISLAVVLGTGTALAVFLFRRVVVAFDTIANQWIGQEGIIGEWFATSGISPTLGILITLPLAGFIVGSIIHFWVGHEKYHGVASIMASVSLSGGRLPHQKIIYKTIASALSLGAGASVGPEDPSVQIGANLGSFISESLSINEEKRKLLVAGGAASAIAAAFNAPIAGVFFALEIILGEFSTKAFGIVVISAVVSSAVMQTIIGVNPIFGELDYVLGHPIQLPFYVILGVFIAGVSILFIRFMDWQHHIWNKMIKITLPIKVTLGGVIVASVGLFVPEVLGSGEEFMHSILTGHIETTVEMLIIIAIAKISLTGVSQAAGFVGGVFAPTLFIGIVLGSAYGHLLNQTISVVDIGNPQAYAIAGMAGLLAGVIRAPMTAILLVFELTNDYNLILPIMLTAVVCTLIVERFGPPGIYLWSLIKSGVHLDYGRDVDLLQSVQVHEVITKDFPTVTPETTIKEMIPRFNLTHSHGFPIVDSHRRLIGIITLTDIDKIHHLPDFGERTAKEIGTTENLITVYEHDPIHLALRRMNIYNIGRLPVIESDESQQYLGVIRRADILLAYEVGLARKSVEQYQKQLHLRNVEENEFIEVAVEPNAPMIGRSLMEFPRSDDCLIVSIRRNGHAVIAHGNTKIEAGDIITAYVYPEAHDDVIKQFKASPTE